MIPASDIEIYRSAYAVIQQQRANASSYAEKKADDSYVAGDLPSYVMWRRIVRAIEDLQVQLSKLGNES